MWNDRCYILISPPEKLVYTSFFFFLAFFDLRILISTLVSSNSSYSLWFQLYYGGNQCTRWEINVIIDNGIGLYKKMFFCLSVLLNYMCNFYWYMYINVHTLFYMYFCYNCYVIQRRRLHILISVYLLHSKKKWYASSRYD
jgi:hypothetical protein